MAWCACAPEREGGMWHVAFGRNHVFDKAVDGFEIVRAVPPPSRDAPAYASCIGETDDAPRKRATRIRYA